MILRLRQQGLPGRFNLAVDQARIIVVHMSMRVLLSSERRIDAGFHYERPFVGIAEPIPNLKPGRRVQRPRIGSDHLYRCVVEVLMNPVRMAIEILNRMKRGPESY